MQDVTTASPLPDTGSTEIASERGGPAIGMDESVIESLPIQPTDRPSYEQVDSRLPPSCSDGFYNEFSGEGR